MKVGDLVRVVIPSVIPGALTAVKFFKRLAEQTEGKVGLIVQHGVTQHVIVQFPTTTKVIHKRYLEVVREDGRHCKA